MPNNQAEKQSKHLRILKRRHLALIAQWSRIYKVQVQINSCYFEFVFWGVAKINSGDEINVCLGKNELSLMEEHKSVASGKAETAPLFWESLDTQYKDRICIHGAQM